MARSLGLKNSPELFVDSGSENINSEIDSLIQENLFKRTMAQINVEFSNSMIEALFHRLKHRHLFR